MLIKKYFCLGVALSTLTGCISTVSVNELEQPVTRNFGYTKIIRPKSIGDDINASQITNFGLSFEQGVTLGYKKDFKIQIPINCHIVFLVKDKAQLDYLIEKIPAIKQGNSLCITETLE